MAPNKSINSQQQEADGNLLIRRGGNSIQSDERNSRKHASRTKQHSLNQHKQHHYNDYNNHHNDTNNHNKQRSYHSDQNSQQTDPKSLKTIGFSNGDSNAPPPPQSSDQYLYNNDNYEQDLQEENQQSNNYDEVDGVELASKTLTLQLKRFYIDVKQNKRGKFIKIAGLVPNRRKSRIIFSMDAAQEFCNHLERFSRFDLNSLDKPPIDERLMSERMQKDQRTYFLDLKENSRGRYLRCTQITSSLSGTRSQIIIPAECLLEFRDNLQELLTAYGNYESEEVNEQCPNEQTHHQQYDTKFANASTIRNNPNTNNADPAPDSVTGHETDQIGDSKVLKLNTKRFYFDIGQNNFGVFLKVSEVKPTIRTTITIPDTSWVKFRDIIDEFISQQKPK